MDGVRHTRYGWWLEEAGPVEATAPLESDTSADVVVVGGGYLGLWTAWQLKALEPACDVVVLEESLAGHGPSGRNGGFVSTLWDDLPILRDRVGDDAGARRRPGVRARRARHRRVVRASGRGRLVPGRADARGGDERGATRRVGRRDRGLRGTRRAGGDPSSDGRRAPGALRWAVPRRGHPADVRDRPARAARARAPREGRRGGRAPARADARPPAPRGRGRDDAARPRPRGRRGARREQRDRGLPGLPARSRGRVEPHGPDRAGARRARGARLDGRRDDRRLPHAPPLPPDDARRPDRVRLGRRPDGLRRAAARPARRRPGARRARPATTCSGSSRSSAAGGSRTPGAARSTSPPPTCRSSAAAAGPPRLRLHRQRRRPVATSAARSSPGSRSTAATS